MPADRPTFQVVAKDGAGRLGRYATRRGVVQTPTLLPVINPNQMLIPPKEMRRLFGTEMVITNSYIIKRTERLRARALAEGVHKLIDWDGPVMTDSGTFQMYVYGSVEVQPEEIVEFERDIGVDVGTILDIFSTPDRTHDEAERDMKETLERAERASRIKGDMALAATVQGGVWPDLRERCAEAYRRMDVDFHPVGGVVPLMEQQRYAELVDVIVGAKKGLDPSRPVHLFGAGHPVVFPLAALLGCDVFDSASYAKYAKDGRMMFPDGTRALADLEETPCPCPVCSTHGARGLKALDAPARERALAEHNLHVSFAEIRAIRQAIREGSLWELVERRCRAHPSLVAGLRAAVAHADWIETLEPISKPTAFFGLGDESRRRPEVLRARRRLLERFTPRGDLLELPPARKPFSSGHADRLDAIGSRAVEPVVSSIFGPIPLVLDEVWPFAQSVECDPGAESEEDRTFVRTLAKAANVGVQHVFDAATLPEAAARNWDVDRVRAVCDWQFGRGAADALLVGEVVLRKGTTGKIRNVHAGGEHVLSMRASDGLFTLKAEGGRRLAKAIPGPRLRIVVHPDSAPFNRQGKNVMAKFVESVDPALRAYDETLVVTPEDELVAVAQLLLAPAEIPFFKVGVAAAVREGIP